MARKKKPLTQTGKLDVTKSVKAAARERVGSVPPTRAVPDAKSRQKKRTTKHKPKLAELISLDE